MYYKLLSSGFNNKDIYNDNYKYGYYNLNSLELFEKCENLVKMEVGKLPIDTSIEYKNEVKCSAAELRVFDFLHGNCEGGGIVSPRVAAYFMEHFPGDVAFARVSIKTSTDEVNEYKLMIFTSFAGVTYDLAQSYSISNPQHTYLYNPAYIEGAIPKGRILVHDPGATKLLHEDDALELEAQGFIGLGLEKVKMAKTE